MSDLHRAIRRGDIAEVRRLLAGGMPVDIREEHPWGWTALMEACVACMHGPPRGEIVRLLIEAGADVNAWTEPEDGGKAEPLLVVAARHIGLREAQLLVAAGADMNARASSGDTVLTSALGPWTWLDVFDFLLEAGAPTNGPGKWGMAVIEFLSVRGEFSRLAKVLATGEDSSSLKWTPLCHAVVFGSEAEVLAELDAGADIEHVDHNLRTPFILAVHAGRMEIAALLLGRGADRNSFGRPSLTGPTTALDYAIRRDNAAILRWLLDLPVDIGGPEWEIVMDAAQRDSVACCRLLLEAGFDWRGETPHGDSAMSGTSHPEIVKMLLERGANPSHLQHSMLGQFVGLATTSSVEVTWQNCLDGFHQRFGTANPERMQIPFWDALVRGGWEPEQVDGWFRHTLGRNEVSRPWCFKRRGISLTALPDGRFIQVGGTYKKSWDFCIYNDVIVHDGKGDFEIYGYPQEVFPPTDFHSATLVGEWIYLIGNLGYRDARGSQTPVYRLHTCSLMIEKVEATGESPGWIHGHEAVLKDGRIRVSDAETVLLKKIESWSHMMLYPDPVQAASMMREEIVEHPGVYWLDLTTGVWEREAALPI